MTTCQEPALARPTATERPVSVPSGSHNPPDRQTPSSASRTLNLHYGAMEFHPAGEITTILLRTPWGHCAVDLTAKEAREVAELLAKAANLSDGKEERRGR